jgi:hypothetical protein
VARAFSSRALMLHVRGGRRFASGSAPTRLSLLKPIERKFYYRDSEAHDAVRREIWRPLSIYFKESS